MEGVENLFLLDSRCCQLYHEMVTARERLLNRLEIEEDDPDVEGIIAPILEIIKIVGLKMFENGMQLEFLTRKKGRHKADPYIWHIRCVQSHRRRR